MSKLKSELPRKRFGGMGNWSIAHKLSAILILVALLPMIFIAVFNLLQGLQDAEITAEQNLELLADSVVSRLDQLLEDNQVAVKQISANRELARFIAGTPLEQEALRSSVEGTLEETLHSNPFFEYVYVMDSEGNTLISRQLADLPSIEGRNFGNRAYFIKAMEGIEHIDILVGRSSGLLGFYFSTPVELDGEIVGVAITKLQGEAITRVINEFNQESRSSFAFLIDQDGVVVSHPSEQWQYHSLVPLSREAELKVGQRFVLPGCEDPDDLDDCHVESLGIPELAEIRNATEVGNVEYVWPEDGSEKAGTTQILGYAPTSGDASADELVWIVCMNQARAEFEKPLRTLFTQSAFSVAIVGILVAVLALVVARSIARPIGKLAAVAQDVEEDKPFSPQDLADVTSQGDELGHLARVFSDMVLALRARMAELRTVYQIGQDITATLEVEETLQAILNRVRDAIDYDAAEITLLDREQNALIVAAWKGEDKADDTRGRSYLLNKGYTGIIGQERRSLLITDTLTSDGQRSAITTKFSADVPVRSLLGVPLLIRDRLVGTLELTSRQAGAFDEDDQRLLETIAPQAAIAIQKAQQIHEREQRLQNQIEQLRIEIDEAKRQRQVEQIVETDYFQNLRQKAQAMRQQSERKRSDGEEETEEE